MTNPIDYYKTLPKKRMGAGCLLFNTQNQLLLVKPTYKPGWEIPGGIVELNESPKQCCERELFEELGLKRTIGRLLIVDYNHPTPTKTESLMFIFDGGILSETEIASIQLPSDELQQFIFFSQNDLPAELSLPLRHRILSACQQFKNATDAYLER